MLIKQIPLRGRPAIEELLDSNGRNMNIRLP